MPRARNPQHLCKQSSTPETKDQRRARLDARRIDQREGRTANVVQHQVVWRMNPISGKEIPVRIPTRDVHGLRVDRNGVSRSKSWKHVYGSKR